ncbi:hypothetical protein HPB50_026736 [Hyalomma asiaticum]|uniref:Uncharacterized protein n=1 Tax=Hyalomma asiaticum TaxID=266040 RepID=A0ACB7SU80_HYAAI|nr:hypothetical protein HPB50_026736 [Hyalomma asiaticum]
MDDSERKSDRRSKSKSRSRRSSARYDDAQDEGEEYGKTARRKKTKGSKVGISESPSHSKGAESSKRRRKGSDSTQDAAESSSLPKELNYEYFEQLDSNLRRAGELLEEHGRGIVWQAADVITCIPEYCPPRCYMTKLCRCNTCCERCCLDTEHRLTGFHSNAKDEGTDVPDEDELTLSGSSDTSVASLLGDLSSDEGTSKASARLATAARDAKRAVRLAKQFRAAARTIDSLECSNESEHQMRALYTKELMDKAVFYAKKANEALAGYAALRRALRGIADTTSGDDISRLDAIQDAQRRPPYDPSLESTYLQGEQPPYGPPSHSARGYGSAPEFAGRYPQQPGAQMPLPQAVPAAVGQGYRFGGARGVPCPLDAQRLRWASAPVVGYPPSLQTTLSLSRMAEMVVNKAQQASEEALRFQRASNEALAEAKILERVSDDRLPPFESKEYRKVPDVRPIGVVAFDEMASECAIDRGPHVPKGIARVRMSEATGADSERQPGQLSEQGLTKSKSFDNDLTMRRSNTVKRPARKGGSSNLEADLPGKGGPRTPVPSTMPPMKQRATRRASVSAAVASQMQNRAAVEQSQEKPARPSGRRASVSSLQQELSDTVQPPPPRKMKSLAARRASVGAGLLLKLGAHMKDSSESSTPEGEHSVPAAAPDSASFKARATRRASVSSRAPLSQSLNEDPDAFRAKATRRASVSSKGLSTPLDRTTADPDSFKARASRRASVSSKALSPPDESMRNEQDHSRAKALRRASVSSRDLSADHSKEHETFKARAARRASVSAKRIAIPIEGRTSPTGTPKSESRAHKAKGTKVTVVEPDVPEVSSPAAKKPRRRASVCAAKYKCLYGDVSAEENTKGIGGDKGETESDEPIEPRKQARRPSINATRMSSDAVKAGPEKPESRSVGHDKGASSEDKEHNTQPPAALSQDKTLLSLIRESLEPNTARTGVEETKDAKGGRIVVKIKPPPVHMSSKKVGTRRAAKDKDFFTEICDERLLNNCGSHPIDPREIEKIIDEGVGKPKYTKDMDKVQEIPSRIPEIIYELSEQSLDMEVIPSERCKETQISLPFDGASFREHHRNHTTASTDKNAKKEAHAKNGLDTTQREDEDKRERHEGTHKHLKHMRGSRNIPPEERKAAEKAHEATDVHSSRRPSSTAYRTTGDATSASGYQDLKSTSPGKQAQPDSTESGSRTHLKVLPSDTYVFVAATAAIAGGDAKNPKATTAAGKDSKKGGKETAAAENTRKSPNRPEERPKHESDARRSSRHSKESLKQKTGSEILSRPSNESLKREKGIESTRRESGAEKHSRHSKESMHGETGAGKHSRRSNESVHGEAATGQPSKPSNESLRRETHAENKRSSSLKPAQGSSDSVKESSKRQKIPPMRTENDDRVRDEQRSVRDSVGKVENRADKIPSEGKRKVSRDAWAADLDVKGAEASAKKGEDRGGSKNVKSSEEDTKWHEGSAKEGEHDPVEVIDKRRGSGSKREARQNRGSVSQKETEEVDDKTRGKRTKNADDDTAQQSTTDGGHSKYSDRRGEKRHSDGYLKDANKKTEEKKQPTKVAESPNVTKAVSQAQDEDTRAPMESRTDKQSNAPMDYLGNPGVPSSWSSIDVEEGRAVYTTGKLREDAEALRKIQATNIARALRNFDADEQKEISIPDGVHNSELPRNILRTNDKFELAATARNDADFTDGRYQRVPTGAKYIPEDENRDERPDGADGFYSDQQLAFPVRQNTIGPSSSGTDAPSNEPNNAGVLGQKSAELVLPKKLAFGGDDWTIVSPLDLYADHSEVSRPGESEDMTVGDAAEVEPRSGLFNPAKTCELHDDIADADLPEPEGSATWSQQQEGEQWEGGFAEGEQPEEPPAVELPEELPEEELPQEYLEEQEYLEGEAPENNSDVAVKIPEPEISRVQQALGDPQDHGMQEVIELQNVDYELQSRPHAPLRGPDIRDFNFWDLDGPAVLYPESRLVFALAFVAGMWILYLLFTTKATPNRKPFLELFAAPATEHEIRRDHIVTEPFGVNDLKTKGVVAATEIESVVSARPQFLYFCDTPYCKESALHLASMLGEEPCLNFYRYVCDKMTRKWNPMVGSALSTDAFMVNEAAKLTSDYILNQEHPGMKPARNLLEACLDHEHDEQWGRTELSELFFEYFGSSWPAESNPVTMEAVWVIAGRLARDLKLEALARVSVNVHPEDNSANVPAIDEPVLLYRRADFEEPEYMDMLKTAIEQALAFLSPANNSAPHISSIKTTMEQLADMVSTDPAGSVGARKHQLTKVHLLATGVHTFLRTVLPDSITVPGNTDILVKSPRFFENLQGSKGSLLDPQAVFDYLGFRVVVHFAAFLPQPSVQRLRALEAGYLLPKDAYAQDFCTREVERVFPAIFARAFALRTTNLSNWLSAWSSELNRIATRIQASKAEPVTAQNDADITRQVFDSLKIEAAAPQWILNDSSFERYAQGLEQQLSVALNLDPSNSLKRLCFFTKMLRQDEMEQALQGTSDNQSAVSLFGTEPKYDALSNTIYMPLVTVNWSLPADSIAFAVHAARYAVRVSKALVPMLRQDNAHSSEQFSSSDRHYQQQLNAMTKCMVEQYENASRNLKSTFLQVTDHTPLGPALSDQTVALMHAYSVFKEKLRARRFEKANFRLSGLPHLTPEQLFFVAYGHDNCEASNTIHQRRWWFERGELPAEDRVNFPLMQFEEFARVFTCNGTAPMVANRRCPMAHTATTDD